MSAILKREFGSYFSSPVGYVVVAAFVFFSGLFVYMQCLSVGTSSMTDVFGFMFSIELILIPLLTMRSFAEEKKQKTEQVLLTAPVNIASIVTAKYLAALLMLLVCLSSYVVDGVVLSFLGKPDWSLIIGNVFGTLILGSAFIAIGIFISSLTESMIIAAVASFAVNMLISLTDTLSLSVSWEPLADTFQAFSFQAKYRNFALGLVSLSDVLFFVTIAFFFLFLTDRLIERRRWA